MRVSKSSFFPPKYQLLSKSTLREVNVKVNLLGSINSALNIAMETDKSAVIFGEDVGFGGVFRATSGLRDKFGSMHFFFSFFCGVAYY
jgi:2-oxoisovalerate dehydrogenase E1 component beta subunit